MNKARLQQLYATKTFVTESLPYTGTTGIYVVVCQIGVSCHIVSTLCLNQPRIEHA